MRYHLRSLWNGLAVALLATGTVPAAPDRPAGPTAPVPVEPPDPPAPMTVAKLLGEWRCRDRDRADVDVTFTRDVVKIALRPRQGAVSPAASFEWDYVVEANGWACLHPEPIMPGAGLGSAALRPDGTLYFGLAGNLPGAPDRLVVNLTRVAPRK